MSDNANNDLTGAILENEPEPHVVRVEEALLDNSVVTMSKNRMNRLQLFDGNAVFVESLETNYARETICYVYADESCSDDKIKMNQVVRRNLQVRPNETVAVQPCSSIRHGENVRILPIIRAGTRIKGNVYETYLQPYFSEQYRPIQKGDKFTVRGPRKIREFKVIETDPSPYCIVAPQTVIDCEGCPILHEQEEKFMNGVEFEVINGIQEQLSRIKKMFASSPRRISMYGPLETEKKPIARAIATKSGAFFFFINGPVIMRKMAGGSGSNQPKVSKEAEKHLPAIIFIHGIDGMPQKWDKAQGEVRKRIILQLQTLMDGMKMSSDVIVIAITDSPYIINDALDCLGQFIREFDVRIPDATGCAELCRVHTKTMKLTENVELEQVVPNIEGNDGDGIAAPCSEDTLKKIREHVERIDLEEVYINDLVLASLKVTMDKFRLAKPAPQNPALEQKHEVSSEETNDFYYQNN